MALSAEDKKYAPSIDQMKAMDSELYASEVIGFSLSGNHATARALLDGYIKNESILPDDLADLKAETGMY